MPTAGSQATFTGAGNGQTTIGLGGTTQNVSSIVFTGTPAAYTLGATAGDAFNFGSAGIVSVGPTTNGNTVTTSQTINAGLVINGGSITVNNAAAATTLALNGAISGSGGLGFLPASNANGGSIRIAGNNTCSGGTNVNSNSATTILIGSNVAFGTGVVTMDNTSNSPLEGYGSNVTLDNAVTLTYGFTVADAATMAHDLAFTGPIAFGNATRTLTFNNYGQTVTLGSSASPSTITMPTNTGSAGKRSTSPA